MRAPLLRLLRNSSTSGSPLQQSEIVTRAALAVPQCAQQRRCSDRFAPTRLPRARRRGTAQQASPRRGAFSGLKNNSATAPSSPPGASPPLRCVGDCCFRKTLSGLGRSALSRAQQPPSCLRPRGSFGAVAALLSASDPTQRSACTSQRGRGAATGQHLGSLLGSHSHWAHP